MSKAVIDLEGIGKDTAFRRCQPAHSARPDRAEQNNDRACPAGRTANDVGQTIQRSWILFKNLWLDSLDSTKVGRARRPNQNAYKWQQAQLLAATARQKYVSKNKPVTPSVRIGIKRSLFFAISRFFCQRKLAAADDGWMMGDGWPHKKYELECDL